MELLPPLCHTTPRPTARRSKNKIPFSSTTAPRSYPPKQVAPSSRSNTRRAVMENHRTRGQFCPLYSLAPKRPSTPTLQRSVIQTRSDSKSPSRRSSVRFRFSKTGRQHVTVGRAAVLGFALSRSRVLAALLWSSITFFSAGHACATYPLVAASREVEGVRPIGTGGGPSRVASL